MPAKAKRKAAAPAAEPSPAAAADGAAAPAAEAGRKWTLSIAVPGTALDAAPSLEAAVCAAAQTARAMQAFQVRAPATWAHQQQQQQTAKHPCKHSSRAV